MQTGRNAGLLKGGAEGFLFEWLAASAADKSEFANWPRRSRAKQRSDGELGHGMSHWRGSIRQAMTGTAMT